jgi:N-acetylmuramoyl-L-alanine amidase
MTGLYYSDMLDVLVAAGCRTSENSTTKGWQTRARSSGGFPAPPLCTFWHHTASSTSPESDLSYMINGSDDAPVGNMLIDRDGVCWPIAAGASNCAGKGGPATFSRGTIPADQGNTRGWQIEVANNGVGEAWSVETMDAFFRASNAMNARFGNPPTDVITHQVWAPTRKIDPATASAVQGGWKPRSCTSSGTWELDDIRAECTKRATAPTPAPDREDDMLHIIAEGRGAAIVGPGYWHFAHSDNEAYLWQKLYGPPRVMDNPYDYDLTVKTHALQPDDASQLGPT